MAIDPEALRILMEKDGSTIVSLSGRVGISRQYMGDIVAGRRTLKRKPQLIKELAGALGVPTSMIQKRAPGEAA
jgi:transcriptional regulator with XRE-family HTH domain